ncbi:lantibiotic dehydratase [Streptomyces sp. NPDC020965]|uniref:lantibiotic dehydratase n=1 Tax=Streptomyces sp. NPDC020965 TaxID=3365105 RepID=UPI00378DBCCB
MERYSHFVATGPVILRASTLPSDSLDSVIAEFGKGSIPPDREIVDYISRLYGGAVLREAVAVSSDALSEELDKVVSRVAPVSRKKLMRMAVSLTRYARRITGRPTPFGLFAGVSQIVSDQRGSHGERCTGVKAARPDAGWFDGLAAQWQADPRLRGPFRVVTNNLCFVRGDRMVLPCVRGRENAAARTMATREPPQELSTRHTPLLAWVRAAAARPIAYGDLLAAAVAAHPQLGEERLDVFLGNLITHEILLSELNATRLDGAYLQRLERKLPSDSRERSQIAAVRNALEDYSRTEVGQGLTQWRHAVEVSRKAHASPAVAPQVDLRWERAVGLPMSVRREVEQYAGAIWTITSNINAFPHMRDYRRAFIDFYGQHGAVRLEELVDPHRGMGYPATYLHPRTNPFFPSHEQRDVPHEDKARTRALADVLHRGLASGGCEVVLTDEDIRRLSVTTVAGAPSSLELCFQLLAGGRRELDAGDFVLLASPVTGALTAGSMAGRFATLLGNEKGVGSLLDDAAGTLPAQVDFTPVLPRALNVMQVPRLLPHSIPVGAYHDPQDAGCIDWRDLIVAADGDMLRLYWEKTGREVSPAVPHVLSLQAGAPNLARLLGELPYCGESKVWQPWDWGAFQDMPCLPQVRLGRVIVSPRTWRPTAALLEQARVPTGWDAAVGRWRDELGVSDQVNAGRHDQTSELDLSNTFQREMFRRELQGKPLTVTESPKGFPAAYGWLDGHSNEIVVPLRGQSQPERARPSSRELDRQRVSNTQESVARRHGSEWACVELHAVAEVHEEIITRHIPPLVKSLSHVVDRWFFIRYRQAGDHIRLRMHGHPEDVATTVWPELLKFCDGLERDGMIRDHKISPYVPETSRYGGIEGVRRAENWFHLDSQVVTGLLAASRPVGGMPARNDMIIAGYAHLLESLGIWDWRSWLDRCVPRKKDEIPVRREVEVAVRLARTGAPYEFLSDLLAEPYRSALPQLTEAARGVGKILLPGISQDEGTGWRDTAVASLLHMHHNRLFGLAPRNESASLALLAHAARTHLSAARHEARTEDRKTAASGKGSGA